MADIFARRHPERFQVTLSVDEARELAHALGDLALRGVLTDKTLHTWQILNSAVINYDSRHIDGGN